MDFHEKLARLTEDRNKAAVAQRAGLQVQAIHRLLSRKQQPGAAAALKIARALCVSVDWLLDDDQDWPPIWMNAPETPGAKVA